ncbi:MAG: methylmalonyl-CoA mutase [Chlorobiaceae bacterium]|nr:methylmalonyl-CoA mutase [Chlorobiaceae bacterium]
MTNSRPDSLFHEFPAVSRTEWHTKAAAELKERAYDTIVWHTPDGFDLEPWHSHEEKTVHLELPPSKGVNTWKNCHRITVHDAESANKAALKSFELDAAAIEFLITDPALCSSVNLTLLLEGIKTSAVSIYFSGNLPPVAELLRTLDTFPGFSGTSGGVLAATPATSNMQDPELFRLGESLPGFRFLTVDTIPFHEKGSNASQEIALALAGASDYLHRYLQEGVPADRILSAMEIILPVGSSHFTEIAKPRALRHLMRHLLKAYNTSGSPLPLLFARTSERNRSLLDPYTNVLRLTTEAVSAILGGYDTLQIGAFDSGHSVNPEITERITGNIHLILKEEASLDRVVDPAHGSHYLEAMTRKLAESAWTVFKAIEAAGGMAEAAEKGIIEAMVAESAANRQKSLDNRKKTLIGVNRYPWPLTAEQEENISLLENDIQKLPESNETAGYELLRLKTLSSSLKSGRTPSLFIWMHGDPAVSFRQAAFAEDFFKCGGFEIAGRASLPLEEDSYSTALESKPDIVVLCIAEKDPVPTVETLCKRLRSLDPEILPVMAGKPPKEHEVLLSAGLDSFVYTGVNVLEMLKSYQRKTGVQ